MDRLVKHLSLFLVVILAVSSLLMFLPVKTETIPKPSVPEFTVRFVENSYNQIQNKTIELAIINQPFTSFYVSSNDTTKLYYQVQVKSFSSYWYYINYGYYGPDNPYFSANTGQEYTLLTFGLTGNNGSGSSGLLNLAIPAGGKADFKVQAFIGYYNKTYNGMPFGENYTYTFTGQSSEWSTTQTITIPASTSPSPTIPEFPITVSLVAVLAAMSLLLIFGKRKLTAINH
jgi:hypothetical protein